MDDYHGGKVKTDRYFEFPCGEFAKLAATFVGREARGNSWEETSGV